MKIPDYGVELSFLSLEYPVFRGNIPAILSSIKREGPLRPYSHISFSIHNISHIDLPWCIETQINEMRKRDPTLKPLPGPKEMNDLMKSYSSIKIFDTVVIDITDKQRKMEKFVNKDYEVLNPDISPDTFEELIKLLKITEEDITKKLSLDDLKEKFILFKTNYDAFSARAVDFSNSYFECRHAYLLAPYFEFEEPNLLTKLIEEQNIAGIGSDSYGLENPLYLAQRHNLPQYAIDYYEKYNRRKKFPFASVLARLMTEQKYYIKNLRNLKDVTTDNGYALGELTVVPFALGNRDANAVRVFFKGGNI